MELDKKDKKALTDRYVRYVEQNERIKSLEQNIEKVKDEILKEVDKLKLYRQEDFDLIDEIEKKYQTILTTELILKIINE